MILQLENRGYSPINSSILLPRRIRIPPNRPDNHTQRRGDKDSDHRSLAGILSDNHRAQESHGKKQSAQ